MNLRDLHAQMAVAMERYYTLRAERLKTRDWKEVNWIRFQLIDLSFTISSLQSHIAALTDA
jgi:hypothetical protein